METMVVKVGNLKEFMQEARPFSDVRFSQHKVDTYAAPLGYTELCLDLMGFNEMEELVWLHHSVSLQLAPGSTEPWTEHGKAVYAAYPGLVELVREYLHRHGNYIVRPGLYGVAQDIAPLNGDLEIVRWDPGTQGFVRMQTDARMETQLREAQK